MSNRVNSAGFWLQGHRRHIGFVLVVAAFIAVTVYLNQFVQLPDFRNYPAGPERKTAFFSYMRPVLALENARISEQRRMLERIANRQRPVWLDHWRLSALAEEYGVDDLDGMGAEERVEILLRRVDVVPLALGLAQAAKESGWGTSRFAREGNSLFGEWCFTAGCGIAPRRRDEGRSHMVRAFPSPAASVRSYLDNLNTHPRYGEFRRARARIRAEGRAPSALELAAYLHAYSQRRQAYIDEISGIIRFNQLEEEDSSLLSASPRPMPGPSADVPESFTATVLLYHHVDVGTPPSTSVTPAQFERHLRYLDEQGFEVVPLADVVDALHQDGALPPRAVVLTFDDAYLSVYTEALPRLEARGWPFTVFATTDYLDAGAPVYMDWTQLADLEQRGGTVGNHSQDHAHLVRRAPGESERKWRLRVRENISGAQVELERRLARPLEVFAYPYGEYDSALEEIIDALDLDGLGQQSGPVGPQSSPLALPRFPVATDFADMDSLAEKLRSRALPVEVLAPAQRVLPPAAEAPLLRLRLGTGEYDRQRLQCFVSGQENARLTWHGDILEVRARSALGPGRSKYTCTAPSTTIDGVYYWYSHLWIQPQDDGTWYEG